MQFTHNPETYNTRAAQEIVPYLVKLLSPQSVIDVGCGIGTWLSIFKEYGVNEVVGVDGNHVNQELLLSHIQEHEFIAHDLNQSLKMQRKFDLVISLEVAEHLPEESADNFVKGLTQLGNYILFSAAIPGQGGDGHINEQWADYWQAKFEKFNFSFNDCIRSHFWLNQKVDWWYRQNIFLVCSMETQITKNHSSTIENLVHPDLYKTKLSEINYLHQRINDILAGNISLNVALRILSQVLINKLFFLKN